MAPGGSGAVRVAAVAGIVGPAAFVAAWSIGAAVTAVDYSMIDDPISRLAAVGADTRVLMTGGFVAFGLALPVYAWSLRQLGLGAAWITAAGTGLATLAVAAAPLDHSARVDTLHGVFATIGYVTLAATPVLASRSLRRRGHHALATGGLAAAAVAAVALALTATNLPTGLFQRLGLTVGDLWIAACAAAIATGRIGPRPSGTHDREGPTGAR